LPATKEVVDDDPSCAAVVAAAVSLCSPRSTPCCCGGSRGLCAEHRPRRLAVAPLHPVTPSPPKRGSLLRVVGQAVSPPCHGAGSSALYRAPRSGLGHHHHGAWSTAPSHPTERLLSTSPVPSRPCPTFTSDGAAPLTSHVTSERTRPSISFFLSRTQDNGEGTPPATCTPRFYAEICCSYLF